MASVAGLNPDGLMIDMGTPAEESVEVAPEAVLPAGNPSNAAPAESAITNSIPVRPKLVVPVG